MMADPAAAPQDRVGRNHTPVSTPQRKGPFQHTCRVHGRQRGLVEAGLSPRLPPGLAATICWFCSLSNKGEAPSTGVAAWGTPAVLPSTRRRLWRQESENSIC